VKNWKCAKALRALLPKVGQESPIQKVLMFVHRPSHWVLAVLGVPAAQFTYLDSANPTAAKARHALEPIKNWMNIEAAKQGVDIPWQPHLVPERGDIPKQYNLYRGDPDDPDNLGVDCGIFTMLFALAECHGIDLKTHPFAQAHVPAIRRRIGLEIARSNIPQMTVQIEGEEILIW
jgi:Ulp1 family protease